MSREERRCKKSQWEYYCDGAPSARGLWNGTVSEGVVCNRRLSLEILFSQRGGFHEQYYLHRRGSRDRPRYSVVCWSCLDSREHHRLICLDAQALPSGEPFWWHGYPRLLELQGVPEMYPTTPDGRYFVVKGRLWRCSNPSLDEDVRQRLVRAHRSAS